MSGLPLPHPAVGRLMDTEHEARTCTHSKLKSNVLPITCGVGLTTRIVVKGHLWGIQEQLDRNVNFEGCLN